MSAGLVLDVALVVTVLAVAAWTVLARDAFAAVIGFAVNGLLLAVVWVRLAAVDVALTEAAVGTVTAALLIGAAGRLRGVHAFSRAAWPGPMLRLVIGLLCLTVAGALGAAVLLLPEAAPSLAPAAAANLPATGLGNPVTAVLMAYRAIDTLMEKVVLVVGLLAIWSLAPGGLWGGRPAALAEVEPDGPLAFLARVLVPAGVVVGMYVFWVGADAPGGAFQGGTVLAAMIILALLGGLIDLPPLRDVALRIAVVAGALVFFAVGLGGLVLGEAFLAYPLSFAKPLILFVETALTVSIAVSVALFVAGAPERPPPR